jgi:hypothetical protein
MVDLALLQSVSYIAGALGVCVAAVYYVMNLRETRKTRKMQFLMQTLSNNLDEEGNMRYVTLMNMEWKDYDDFERKYGSDNNPEAYTKRMTLWGYYSELGYLVAEGFVDADTLYDLSGDGMIWAWLKWEPIIKEIRVRYKQPEIWKWFDYLADRLMEVRRRRGVTSELPRTFLRYTPDQQTSSSP